MSLRRYLKQHPVGATMLSVVALTLLLSVLPLPDAVRPYPTLTSEPRQTLVTTLWQRQSSAVPEQPPPPELVDEAETEMTLPELDFSEPGAVAGRSGLSAEDEKEGRRWEALINKVNAAHIEIEEPCLERTSTGGCGKGALAPFFEAVGALRAGKATEAVRVVTLGTSLIASDHITDVARRRLQTRHGSGGLGYMYVDRPTRNAGRTVRSGTATEGWKIDKLTDENFSPSLGLAGVGFSAPKDEPQQTTLAIEGNRTAELYLLTQPNGGDIEVKVDGVLLAEVATAADALHAATSLVELPEGAKSLVLRTRGGPVRLDGVALETGKPGMVFDSLGLPGGAAYVFTRANEELFSAQLAQRHPAMVILMMGGNEAFDLSLKRYTLNEAKANFVKLIQRVKRVAPNAACLLASPPDAGLWKMDKTIQPRKETSQVAAFLHDLAFRQGCAFWDMQQAMGGEGAINRWWSAGLMNQDLVHPIGIGGDVFGYLLDVALERARLKHEASLAQAHRPRWRATFERSWLRAVPHDGGPHHQAEGALAEGSGVPDAGSTRRRRGAEGGTAERGQGAEAWLGGDGGTLKRRRGADGGVPERGQGAEVGQGADGGTIRRRRSADGGVTERGQVTEAGQGADGGTLKRRRSADGGAAERGQGSEAGGVAQGAQGAEAGPVFDGGPATRRRGADAGSVDRGPLADGESAADGAGARRHRGADGGAVARGPGPEIAAGVDGGTGRRRHRGESGTPEAAAGHDAEAGVDGSASRRTRAADGGPLEVLGAGTPRGPDPATSQSSGDSGAARTEATIAAPTGLADAGAAGDGGLRLSAVPAVPKVDAGRAAALEPRVDAGAAPGLWRPGAGDTSVVSSPSASWADGGPGRSLPTDGSSNSDGGRSVAEPGPAVLGVRSWPAQTAAGRDAGSVRLASVEACGLAEACFGPATADGGPGAVVRAVAGGDGGAAGRAPNGAEATAEPFDARGRDAGSWVPLELTRADALKRFFARLRTLETEHQGRVSVVQIGASHTAAQHFTDAARESLAERFGYAGRGFVAAGRASDRLFAGGVHRDLDGEWVVLDAIKSRAPEQIWGLTGVRAVGRPGASFTVNFEEPGAGFDETSRVQVYLLESPGMAPVDIFLNGQLKLTVPSPAPDAPTQVKVVDLAAPGGSHEVRVSNPGPGDLTLFGVSHELVRPGVVYDALGLPGSTAMTFASYQQAALTAQLKGRQADLYVLFFGTNEAALPLESLQQMREAYRRIFSTLRAASPDAACLFLGPTDRMSKKKKTGPGWREAESLDQVYELLEATAAANGCAFWSTRDVMGGEGSIEKWRRNKPPLANKDHVHLTTEGYHRLANDLIDDVLHAYDGWKQEGFK